MLMRMEAGLASPLVNHLGFQWVACIGGLLAGLSMTLGSLFTSIPGIIIFHGIFSGMGLGCVCICAVVSVTYYFERYRGLASGVAAAGNGIGYIVVPLLLNTLMSQYDWRQSVFIYSLFVAFVFFTAGLLLRPLEVAPLTMGEFQSLMSLSNVTSSRNSFVRSRQISQVIISKPALPPIPESEAGETGASGVVVIDEKLKEPGSSDDRQTFAALFSSTPTISAMSGDFAGQMQDGKKSRLLTASKDESSIFKEDKIDDDGFMLHVSNPSGFGHLDLDPSYLHRIIMTPSIIVRPLDRPDSLYVASLQSLRCQDRRISETFPDVQTHIEVLKLMEKQATYMSEDSGYKSKSVLTCSFCHSKLVQMFDLTIFQDPHFLLLTAIFCVIQLAYFIPFVYFFTFASKSGMTSNETVLLTLILGIMHTIGRILGGGLANFPRVDILLVDGITCLLLCACHSALPFTPPKFYCLALYSATFGFLSAIPCPLQALLFVRFLGLDRLTMALGNSSLLKGISAAIGPVIAATITQSTGSLNDVFFWCAGCYALAALIHLPLYMPCLAFDSRISDYK